MKKQINPTIKAHLIRSAFYVILLFAVCVIPLALAQRNATKRSVAKQPQGPPNWAAASAKSGAPVDARAAQAMRIPAAFPLTAASKRVSQAPLKSSGPIGTYTFRILPQPKAPNVVLYDQYDNGNGTATSSQDFETAFDTFDDFNADDFVVPAGQTWNITEVDAQGAYFNGPGPAVSFHVFIYQDAGGLPGTQVYAAMNQSYTGGPTDFVINLASAAVLSEGTYWVSVQCQMDFGVGGQWGFMDRTVQANSPAAWQNPGDGLGTGCISWGARTTCVGDPTAPDQVFRLVGTTGGGTPSPTPTGTPSPTPTPTGTPACIVVNGGFETGDLPPWTDTGDTSFTGVFALNPHSGTFALETGPSTSDGFIDQVLPTVDGQAYDVSFWLENDDATGANRFGASLGGIVLVPEATQAAFGYTLFTFSNVVPGANADLQFIFFNQPSFFYLDDVCVTPSGGGGTPTPTPTPSGTPTCTPGPLWYNGDFNGVNGLANEQDTSLGSGQFASVYDNFIVPDGPGWNVTSVFSDDLISTNVTGATWEIRSGVSEGNGGTLVASGMTVTPVVTPTGRNGFGFTEFMIEVTGLNVNLPPGTYWLNVTPIGDLSGRSFDSNTSGTNCVGTPCGNDLNAFFNSNFFAANFQDTAEQGQATDFSMGVNGTAGCETPTPTPTPTPSATPSATPTATATITPPVTPTPTPTATATTTPRPPPTPRPRPTPYPRPTPR
jgi:hypothetical protein